MQIGNFPRVITASRRAKPGQDIHDPDAEESAEDARARLEQEVARDE